MYDIYCTSFYRTFSPPVLGNASLTSSKSCQSHADVSLPWLHDQLVLSCWFPGFVVALASFPPVLSHLYVCTPPSLYWPETAETITIHTKIKDISGNRSLDRIRALDTNAQRREGKINKSRCKSLELWYIWWFIWSLTQMVTNPRHML